MPNMENRSCLYLSDSTALRQDTLKDIFQDKNKNKAIENVINLYGLRLSSSGLVIEAFFMESCLEDGPYYHNRFYGGHERRLRHINTCWELMAG